MNARPCANPHNMQWLCGRMQYSCAPRIHSTTTVLFYANVVQV